MPLATLRETPKPVTTYRKVKRLCARRGQDGKFLRGA